MHIKHRESKHKPSFSPNIPRAVYDGQDRLGSYRQRDDGLFVAVDRLGRAIGVYDTAIEAADAIGRAAARPAP